LSTERVATLIVGAGVSGLATAAALGKDADYLVLERDSEVGGYCKTVRRDGFVWDYSGHFFHFKHPDVEAWLRANMPEQRVRVVTKRSFVHYGGKLLDFPFQSHIHQLPQAEFVECLADFWDAQRPDRAPPDAPTTFKAMLEGRFGRGICERFLVPYNEKLYACDLEVLDRDAMGRFFPKADFADAMRNLRGGHDESYNATFTYPEGGAIEYVRAILRDVREDRVALGEALLSIDLGARSARTSRREIHFDRLVSSAPLPALLEAAALGHDPADFSANQVLVFNLGFDRKGPPEPHWIYYPERDISFYRVGFYDNIFDADRMSLYVEIGLARGATPDVDALRQRVLDDLTRVGVRAGHRLVAEHHVLMDPAYVHVTRRAQAEVTRLRGELARHGVWSIGRYGGWTYCSIEDNVLEARAWVATHGRGGD
jgi:protoporphyrinogen oxidase